MLAVLLAIWCIVVSIGALYFVGLPSVILLLPNNNPSKICLNLPSKFWVILAPLFGLVIIVLFLQNLLYLGLPIGKSFFLVWLIASASWVWLIKIKVFKNNHILIPYQIILIALFIYCMQAIGVFLVGVVYYIGRGWPDVLNYSMAAQFLVTHSIKSSVIHFENFPYSPDAIRGVFVVFYDRIGVEIYQAFIASSTFTNTKTCFEPIILLSPFLSVIVIYVLAKKLGLSTLEACLAAAIGGSMPGLAAIHLEGFFSQALASPLLLSWPLVISMLTEHPPHWKRLLCGALILAGVTSIYTEYYLIFTGLIFLTTIWLILEKRKKSLLPIISLLLTVPIALLLNIGFIHQFLRIALATTTTNVLAIIYPWSNSMIGLDRAWLGDVVNLLPPSLTIFVNIAVALLLVTAYAGFAYSTYKMKNSFVICMFALLGFLPFLYLLGGTHHAYSYQFYKLFQTICPLLPLGVILGLKSFKSCTSFAPKHFKPFSYIVPVILLIVTITSTTSMIISSTTAESLKKINRGAGFKLLPADTREIQDKLTRIHGKNILIVWNDDYVSGCIVNGWLSYFANKNKIWLANTLVGDADFKPYLAPLGSLPHKFILLTPSSYNNFLTGNGIHKIFTNNTYTLWSINNSDWTLLYSLSNSKTQNKVITAQTNYSSVTTQGVYVSLLSGTSHTIELSGKSMTPNKHATLLISLNGKPIQTDLVNNEGIFYFDIPVTQQTTFLISISGKPSQVTIKDLAIKNLL